MAKPKECPKCKATSDHISNAHEMSEMIGLNQKEVKKWMCGKCDCFFDDDEDDLKSWHEGASFSDMKFSQVADVIFDDWKDLDIKALPYVEAMLNLEDIDDSFGDDSAVAVVSYFLTNSKSWQGPVAQKVKKHLRELVKAHSQIG